MASVNNFDELNNIDTDAKNSIVNFFSEMELPEEEINKRIAMALSFVNIFDRLFILALAMAKVNKIDRDWLITFLITSYVEVLDEYGIDSGDPNIVERVNNISVSVVDTTLANIGAIYYLSVDRAVECAETETNAVSNYQLEQDAIKQGKTRKRWKTMLDSRVRKTHIKADGQEVRIGQPFEVGGYKMMYPLDQSLGASAKEIINCRCVCEYF